MRFNSRELAFLAQQPADRFDRESILFIREKQEGLFRKGEVYVERLFRLRGNLLFYFKTTDAKSEPAGVLVLERCVVELDAEEEHEFSFLIVFEGDATQPIYLAACSEQERDSWIESLHIASYECMKIQLQSMREQLRTQLGRDPIDHPEPSTLPDQITEVTNSNGVPFLEMCIGCDGLPTLNGKFPDTFASIHYITTPSQQWMPYAHTEIVEKSINPMYLTTVGFSNPHTVTVSTRLKLVLYHVKERMTNTMTQIGSTVFTVADVLTAPTYHLRLRLKSANLVDVYHNYSSMESSDVGCVTLMAWENDSSCDMEMLDAPTDKKIESERQPTSLRTADIKRVPSISKELPANISKRLEMLRPMYENITTRTYRFPTNNSGQLSVHEYMAESKLTFTLPKQLLNGRDGCWVPPGPPAGGIRWYSVAKPIR